MTQAKAIVVGLVLFPMAFWATGPFMFTGYWEAWPATHNESVAALTFDDGPNAVYTPQVLNILRAYDVKATFFVTGSSVARHPEIARQIVAQGHEIGNHSMRHEYQLPFLLPQQVHRDYHATQDIIYKATGVTPKLYRPPHGRVSPWMGLTLRLSGARIVGWDVAPRDWQNPPPDLLVQRILDQVKPDSIILLHDGLNLDEQADREAMVQALPRLIEELQHRGYRLVTVSEFLSAGQSPTPGKIVGAHDRAPLPRNHLLQPLTDRVK